MAAEPLNRKRARQAFDRIRGTDGQNGLVKFARRGITSPMEKA